MDRTPTPTAPASSPGSGSAPTDLESAGTTGSSPGERGACIYCGAPGKHAGGICDYCANLLRG